MNIADIKRVEKEFERSECGERVIMFPVSVLSCYRSTTNSDRTSNRTTAVDSLAADAALTSPDGNGVAEATGVVALAEPEAEAEALAAKPVVL